MSHQITFQVEKIRFRQATTGWSVLSGRDTSNSRAIIAAGVFHHVSEGEVIGSRGRWQNHPVHGRQWISTAFELKDPNDDTTLLKFIHQVIFGQIAGLGLAKAKKIISTFGDNTLHIFTHKPEQLATIKGISPQHVAQIKHVWQQHQASKDALLFLASHGLSIEKSRQIIGSLSSHDLSELKAKPYALIHTAPGIGFKVIDELARACGISHNDPQRIEAAIIELCQAGAAQYGHTCIPSIFLQLRAPKFLGLPSTELHLEERLQALVDQGRLVLTTISWNQLEPAKKRLLEPYQSDSTTELNYCYLPQVYHRELSLARHLIRARQAAPAPITEATLRTWKQEYQQEHGTELNAQQWRAVYHAMVEPVFILTGGAGVGKTTTLKAMLWAADRLSLHVGLASPTGRAAWRIKELTGRGAKTLHRLLEWHPHEAKFGRHEDRPLAEDLIIVDECSMLDLNLAQSLVAAIRPGARIIFIGDPHQLPSVGAGAVLNDLITSGLIPTVTLTQVFRQAGHSPIIAASRAILDGQMPEFCSTESSSPAGSSWCHYEYCDSAATIKTRMVTLLEQHLAHLDPLRHIQVLTPMNKGEVGCDSLNLYLQDYFWQRRSATEPPSRRDEPPRSGELHIGDKVIQTANNYDLQVFNGDIGYVIHRELSKQGTLAHVVVEYQDDQTARHVQYSGHALKDLRLGYAITIHKAQGSEFSAVVLPMVRQHQYMFSANLLYTALTRAKHHLLILGDASVMAHALDQPAPPRFTRLAELVKQDVL